MFSCAICSTRSSKPRFQFSPGTIFFSLFLSLAGEGLCSVAVSPQGASVLESSLRSSVSSVAGGALVQSDVALHPWVSDSPERNCHFSASSGSSGHDVGHENFCLCQLISNLAGSSYTKAGRRPVWEQEAVLSHYGNWKQLSYHSGPPLGRGAWQLLPGHMQPVQMGLCSPGPLKEQEMWRLHPTVFSTLPQHHKEQRP